MSKMEMSITVDVTDKNQVKATISVLEKLLGETATPEPESLKEKVVKKMAKKMAKKKKAEPENELAPVEQAVAEAGKTPAKDLAEVEGLTRQDLRVLLSTKVDAHKTALVAKLRELGAKKITTLEEKHFSEFYQFMEAL